MKHSPCRIKLIFWTMLASVAQLCAQDPFLRTGQVLYEGHATAYVIRHLPVNAFPELPAAVRSELEHRGCQIPQTYEAHQPENVVSASLRQPDSVDWAVLCSVNGTVSLLVFFGDSPVPTVLANAPETDRLQPHDPGSTLGFNWGIDPATPEQVHEAQTGLQPRPTRLDHDALADSVLERRTRYHFFVNGHWTLLELPD
ncbi:hypothetical protein ACOBR2_00780 [Telmatobacter bradus]|uniref:hypothetical protein n=1 Tax=Telmatobacter bradus TaxID=474953 RepID=UPI003B428D7A